MWYNLPISYDIFIKQECSVLENVTQTFLSFFFFYFDVMVVLLCHLTNLPQTKAALNQRVNQMRKVVEVKAVIDLKTVHPVIMTKVVTATVQRK